MIRKFARPMLASVFIADGVETLLNQKDHREGASELIARVRAITPYQYISYLPSSETVVLQSIATTKIVAGSAYALGKAPRLAATALVAAQIPTMLARHAFWETQDPKEQKNRRAGFLTDTALLGGLFLATADTSGKPGLAWRAEKAGKQVNKKIQAALPTQSEAEKRTEEVTAALRAGGEDVKEKVGQLRDNTVAAAQDAKAYVDENKDSWIAKARDAFESARDYVEQGAEDLLEKAQDVAQDVSKDTKKQRRAAAKSLKRAEKSARRSAKKAQKKAKKALA